MNLAILKGENMKWDEFLQKIRTYKETCVAGQVNLRANSLITLLYAGAFDGMIGIDRPSVEVYRLLGKELLSALGSKASMPKAKKGDLIGMDKIESNLDLHVWRSSINPTYKFNLIGEFDAFLRNLEFRREDLASPYAYRRASVGRIPETFIFRDVKTLYLNDEYDYFFRTKKALVGVFGVVMDFKVRTTKNGSEMGLFKLFTGTDTTENIYVWPPWRKDQEGNFKRQEFLPREITAALRGNKAGLALVKASYWNNTRQLTLLKWIPTNEKVGGKT